MRLTTSVLAPLRPVARSFTGSTYVLLGFDALRAPGARVEQAGPVLAAMRKAVPLPDDFGASAGPLPAGVAGVQRAPRPARPGRIRVRPARRSAVEHLFKGE